jgi:hypothetical protein
MLVSVDILAEEMEHGIAACVEAQVVLKKSLKCCSQNTQAM